MNSRRLVPAILILCAAQAFAAGPLMVGGSNFGKDGLPFVWNVANMPIQYRVDSGPLSATVDNAAGLARVQRMFNVWQDVSTAEISYTYAGPILDSRGQPVDVATLAQFDTI